MVLPERRVYRHALPTRLGHWLTALCLLVLVMSGLQIFNAHPLVGRQLHSRRAGEHAHAALREAVRRVAGHGPVLVD
ncbi:MAG: hypothetical protein E6G01_01855 [Actinobacteria bacterium]|nr:MAG: hypothetical protein E6G01_01855 [Actinomycetota bacterium]